MAKFIIRSEEKFSEGYYTGESYIFQGEKFIIVSRDKSKAKIYSSQKRAETALQSVISASNVWCDSVFVERV